MGNRRHFIASTGAAAGLAALGPWLPRRAAHDLIIRGGMVFDGTGAAAIESDLGITGGRIAAIAPRIAETGSVEIEARGLAVAPGFIDIHSHADGTMEEDPRMESVVRQGITTVIVGQDGSSSRSVGQALTAADRLRPSVNVASMIGLGTVRGAVVGLDDRPAMPAEMTRMVAMVVAAVKEGACGASTGLEYTPGAFASQEELIALCRPLAAGRLPYSTHMRNEDDRLLDAIDESVAVALGAGCPLQIAHLKTQGPRNWARLDDVFARVATAQREGLDVAFDRYPYIAYQTGLTSLFPVWSRDGGMAAFLARLDEPGTRDRIKTEVLAKVELIGGWDNIHIASVRAGADRGAEGKRLGAYATSKGEEPYALTMAMMTRNGGSIGMVGFAMSEDNLDRILAHPVGMVCSDGGAFATDGPTRRGSPHPRGIGSFPRVIARYVRERKALTLEQAIHKMTALPASRVRLGDRGRLAVGLAGDVVVFDAATITDTATYEQPFSYPTGIEAVIVNGSVTLRKGQRAAQRTGRAIRPS
ncbi:MAG: D-aminoacylase [Gemmatimonadota bacterium]|nr:D-aminoacylase [Gemmatimonadota bacterium]